MSIDGLIKRWRARRQERIAERERLAEKYGWRARNREEIAEQYGYLSDEERTEIDRLRDEHDPIGELARDRGSAWGRMTEDEFKPPRR